MCDTISGRVSFEQPVKGSRVYVIIAIEFIVHFHDHVYEMCKFPLLSAKK